MHREDSQTGILKTLVDLSLLETLTLSGTLLRDVPSKREENQIENMFAREIVGNY